MGPSASLLKYRASEYNRAAQIPKLPVREVTTLIRKHSDEFDPQAALVMMKTGRNWPRPEYLDHEVNFGSLARMLMGLDFKYQADLVSLLQEEQPDLAEVCRLFALSRSEGDELDPVIQHLTLSDDEIMLFVGGQEECCCQFGHMDARHAGAYVQRLPNCSR